jgi:hypothetical protein
VVVPPSNVQAVAPTNERLAPPQGSTPSVIDLTIDDPPSDKGKQKADVEMVDAPDRPGTFVMSGDDVVEAFARWPDFAGLVLARAEEELPHRLGFASSMQRSGRRRRRLGRPRPRRVKIWPRPGRRQPRLVRTSRQY